jgi:hypothetical protein
MKRFLLASGIICGVISIALLYLGGSHIQSAIHDASLNAGGRKTIILLAFFIEIVLGGGGFGFLSGLSFYKYREY